MNNVLAYKILNIGKKEISKESIINLYKTIGAEYEESSIDEFLKCIEGKSYATLVEEGNKLISSMGPVSGGNATTTTESVAAKAEEEKAPAVEEEEVEVDFDLFG
ncbi:60S acidic ribosomal protein P2 [Astathelohania contejeani]|uniref:60S acidic ribosomal protein P2 n=1 Tax=Astathelohania contejeani TaxID=164912 RepID=A0ABQ7HY93_9MICR|nr:60S acidic ribosomal protein P2 [Thelohania contejeani]